MKSLEVMLKYSRGNNSRASFSILIFGLTGATADIWAAGSAALSISLSMTVRGYFMVTTGIGDTARIESVTKFVSPQISSKHEKDLYQKSGNTSSSQAQEAMLCK